MRERKRVEERWSYVSVTTRMVEGAVANARVGGAFGAMHLGDQVAFAAFWTGGLGDGAGAPRLVGTGFPVTMVYVSAR